MKYIIFLFLLMIGSISCLSQKKMVFDEATEKLSKTYYVSFKSNIHVLLKVENDIVAVDFVCWDKFPRQLVSDTLFFDENTQCYVGKISTIRSKKGEPYISADKDNSFFFYDFLQPLKDDEVGYSEHLKEKNYAVWHELSIEYREKMATESLRDFFEIGEERNISNKLETYSFDDFMKEVGICRKLLIPLQ